MQYISNQFDYLLTKLATDQFIFLSLIAISTGLITMTVVMAFYRAKSPTRRRLNLISEKEHTESKISKHLIRFMQSISSLVLPKQNKERDNVNLKLAHAGFNHPVAETIFFASKSFLGVLLLITSYFVLKLFPDIETLYRIIIITAATFIGMQTPNYVLHKLFQKRLKQLKQGFSDALDLLVVCVEAGLGLNAAIKRVSQELRFSHMVLAEELATVDEEIRAGRDRIEALHRLADRTGLEEVKGLVYLLSQSIRLGASIGQSLRVYADDFRDKQMQKAEELAAMIGTKLIFPLVLCIFPAFFVVMIGPAILGVIKALTTQ